MQAKIFHIQKFSLQDGPGIRTTVFFSGCNLHCGWCANPECHLNAKEITLEKLVEEVLKDKVFYDKSGGGVTLSGGEVMLQADFALAFSRALRDAGVRTAMETSGAVPEKIFLQLAESMDFIYMDLKHYDSEAHKKGTGVGNAQILQNLKWMTSSGIEYRIRIPVIPDFNDSRADAQNFCRVLKECGVTHLELLPFHQLGEGKYEKNRLIYAYAGVKALKKEDLQDIYPIFKFYISDVILR